VQRHSRPVQQEEGAIASKRLDAREPVALDLEALDDRRRTLPRRHQFVATASGKVISRGIGNGSGRSGV
jgi:putative aminopeptidase FrvX